ncbi:hypothetical protein PM082_000108 [Marasmius tenuissimus]|nr:hypothetical protein PM082_000108 [Marasmius tenuissimus]
MLTLEGLDNKDHIPVLKKSTPYLHPLFMQVWFKVLDTHHPSWGYWSVIVSDFAPNNLAQQMELAPMYKEGPYIGDEITGPVVARHLRALALKIDRIPLKELILVEEFVKFVPNVWKRSSADPFDSPTTQRPMVHAFSFFIARLISRRTSLAEATVDSMECTYSYTIATLLASLLKSMIDEYPLAIEVIKSGLVRAIFRAYPCLYDLSHERSVSLEPRASLVHWLGGILDQISTFLIYFSVNRTFVRDKKRIAVRCEDHEEFLESRSRYLYDRWMMATEKAEGIRGLRQVLIDNQPSLMCGNANCILKNNQPCDPEVERERPVRYRRCSTCKAAIYCSYECQKGDWETPCPVLKTGHRERCRDLQRNLQIGASAITSHDSQLMYQILQLFVIQNEANVMESIDSLFASLHAQSDSSQDQDIQQILNKTKNPILFCDFERPELPAIEALVVAYDPQSLYKAVSPRFSGEILSIIEMWRSSVNEKRVLAIGFFPHNRMKPIFEGFITSFPLRKVTRECPVELDVGFEAEDNKSCRIRPICLIEE